MLDDSGCRNTVEYEAETPDLDLSNPIVCVLNTRTPVRIVLAVCNTKRIQKENGVSRVSCILSDWIFNMKLPTLS